eukprot:TRINITY_DN19016_c0_g1_i3.p1 TRINITY_DN19016_c0_g1~~TRINITY_DN19016_c0_g1_i3.p1  ORF type:complete len:301 (+),score=59.92 TRINITY_DN19016_c0_g1_i3:58-960(+)
MMLSSRDMASIGAAVSACRVFCKAPIAIVNGNLKIFVNDPSHIKQVLDSVDNRTQVNPLSDISNAVADIINSVSKELGQSFKSPRQILLYAKRNRALNNKQLKFLENLNTTYSMLRHTSAFEISGFAKEVTLAFLDAKNASITSTDDSLTADAGYESSCVSSSCSSAPLRNGPSVDAVVNSPLDEIMHCKTEMFDLFEPPVDAGAQTVSPPAVSQGAQTDDFPLKKDAEAMSDLTGNALDEMKLLNAKLAELNNSANVSIAGYESKVSIMRKLMDTLHKRLDALEKPHAKASHTVPVKAK